MISLYLFRRAPPSVRQILLQERRRRFSYRVVSRHDAESTGKYRRFDRMALKCKPFVNSVDDIQIIETKPNILSPVELKGVVSHEIQPVTVILQQDITKPPPKEPVERFPEGRPNWTHLEHVKIRLTETLPLFFKRQMDLTFYDQDVVVENRLNNTVWRGLQKAAVNVALYRGLAHFRFMQVEMVILNITPVIEDGTVRVRWRVVGVGILRYLYAMMLRNKFASLDESIRANAKWIDGTAIFKVAGDGLVYHVTIDRVMPDNEASLGKAKTAKEKLAAKVGAAVS